MLIFLEFYFLQENWNNYLKIINILININDDSYRSAKIRNFRSNFSNNKDPFAAYDIDQLNCGTFLIHNPFANAIDPDYFSGQFPCVESALFPWPAHSNSMQETNFYSK